MEMESPVRRKWLASQARTKGGPHGAGVARSPGGRTLVYIGDVRI